MVGRVSRRYSRLKRRTLRKNRKSLKGGSTSGKGGKGGKGGKSRNSKNSGKSVKSRNRGSKAHNGRDNANYDMDAAHLADYKLCLCDKKIESAAKDLLQKTHTRLVSLLLVWEARSNSNSIVSVDDIENERKKYDITPPTGLSIEPSSINTLSSFHTYLKLLNDIANQVDKKIRKMAASFEPKFILIEESEKNFEQIYKKVVENAGYKISPPQHSLAWVDPE
jgi:hypothetical protein